MKIAIGMRDKERVNEDHFGQSKFYNIYEYDGSKVGLKEQRKNPHFGVDKHAKVEDIKEVAQVGNNRQQKTGLLARFFNTFYWFFNVYIKF